MIEYLFHKIIVYMNIGPEHQCSLLCLGLHHHICMNVMDFPFLCVTENWFMST